MANTIAWYTAAGCLGMNAPGRVWKQEPVEREEIAMQYDIIIVGSGQDSCQSDLHYIECGEENIRIIITFWSQLVPSVFFTLKGKV